jgi:plastocyanin
MRYARPPAGRAAATACAVVFAGACAVIIASACFSDRTHAPLDGDAAGDCAVPLAAFTGGHRLVVIRDFTFAPNTVHLPRGASVTWVNCEPPAREAHTIAAADASWSSPLLQSGDRYTRRFDASGSFTYTCGPHPHMRATIIVN